MAQVFNPWASPPSSNTLTGDLASFEINGMEGPEMESDDSEDESEDAGEMPETEGSEHGDVMKQALQVISQQAELINKLMASLGKS